MERTTHSPYDAVFKHLLSHRATARDFLDIHLPEHLRELCNLQTLQLESGSFIDEDLRASHSDILYSLQTQAGDGYIYLLIEHQSSADRHMAFRLMRYAIAAMQRHLDKGHTQLPLVIPLLFYHGQVSPWPYPMCWLEGFAHPQTARQVYNQDFHLIDITVLPDDTIMQHRRVAMLELLQKHIRQRDMMELQEQLASLLALGYTSRRQLRTLLHYLLQAGNAADPVAFLRNLAQNVPRRLHKETLMNIAQFLEQRGHQQGLQQGLEQGEQLAAQRIAQAMLENGLDLALVAKLTGLAPERLALLAH
ncbi:Rpn family recombination-promoting nuclease/putative transposase [Klebsiella quasipneumoniae]|uniref:Rpn family recombination-promoting nuclease/putative transposase n=1 Tax=Klebsiella quasipneumoniae TaxID=1463165 RepID=UPI001EDC759B|nr:Rpn family recombination-promoting nuclease/putative transposase [Klebsiella quasipneumoniae]UKK43041.1 Rpn family recombination-promoting nuclease/putative transposase [Klebsiella quasipneumoniae]